MAKSIHWSALLLAGLLLAACDRTPTPGADSVSVTDTQPTAMRPVEPAKGEALALRSHLREVLPDTAYAYLRIPSAWGVIGTPSGGALDKAVGSAPYADAVRSIREGFGANVIPELPPNAQLYARLLLQHAKSPIEAAALASTDPASPLPNLIVTTAVDFSGPDALNAFLQQATANYPQIQVLAPVQPTQAGVIAVAGVPTQVMLDTATSRLYLLSGVALQPTSLAQTLPGLKPTPAHAMRALEQSIDASGHGFFVWFNGPKLLELANAMGQRDQLAMLGLFGINFVKSVGLGIGTSGGIHRLKAVVEMPQRGFRAFLPVIKDAPTFQAAGEPTAVAVLGLPSPNDLVSIEAAASTFNTTEDMKKYREFKQQFAEKMGFSIEDILATLGQDVTFVSDEAGQYIAVRFKDAQKFHSLIDNATQRFGLNHTTRQIGGRTYHHLVMPSLDSLALKREAADPYTWRRKIVTRFFGVPSHTYWVEEGDYLIVASLPQVLMDRNYIATRTPVDQWLKQEQRMEPAGALMMASVRNEGVPAFMYRLNLEGLSYLGDVAERPVDMFAMPTPREAGLPEAGAFGVKLTSSETQLALELAYEYNPAEILLAGNGYTAVAVVGVLAAVAIPAYQDYTVRARIEQGALAVAELKQYLEAFAREHQRYPNEQEIEALDLSDFDTDAYQVSLLPDDGSIVIEFSHSALGEENMLVLVPQVEEGQLRWRCDGDLAQKYLPRQCRE